MCPKPFSWAKKKRKLFSDGKSRGPLLARVALNNTETYNISDVDMNFHSVNPQLCGQNQCSGVTYQMTASNEVWLHEHCLKDISTHLWIIRTNILQISLIILLIMQPTDPPTLDSTKWISIILNYPVSVRQTKFISYPVILSHRRGITVSVENEGSFMIIITYAVKFVTKCNQAVLRDQTVMSRELFSVR